MALTLVPLHHWRIQKDVLEVCCPECEGELTALSKLDLLTGTLNLLCYECGLSDRLELVGWLQPLQLTPSAVVS